MVAPEREVSIDEWISLAEKLTPVENVGLIGLLSSRPTMRPNMILRETLCTEENFSSAQNWSLSHLRKGLSFCSDNYHKNNENISSAVKRLAPEMVTQYNWSLGLAVTFVVLAIQQDMCDSGREYAARKFQGQGKYVAEAPGVEFPGFFNVTYFPELKVTVRDLDRVLEVELRSAAEMKGSVELLSPDDVTNIALTFSGQYSHYFTFTDSLRLREVEGSPENVFPEREKGPNVLAFAGHDLLISIEEYGVKRTPEELDELFRKGLLDTEFEIETATSLTPEYLHNVIAPYLMAIAALQRVFDQLSARPNREIVVREISYHSPIEVSVAGVREVIDSVKEDVVPWRRKHAQQMAQLREKEVAADIKKREAEAKELRARSAKDSAESSKLEAEARKLYAEAEKQMLENERTKFELEQARLNLALELAKKMRSDLPESELVLFAINMLPPLHTLTISDIEIKSKMIGE